MKMAANNSKNFHVKFLIDYLAIEKISFAYSIGLDGVISPDLGILNLVNQKFKELEIIASQTANIRNYRHSHSTAVK